MEGFGRSIKRATINAAMKTATVAALLAPADWVEFGFVRDAVGTSDSALSKQVAALADAGYVEVCKTRNRTGCHTHLRLTAHGR
ncbi:transcriptional regulator [Streptomyces apocyni]|uniref:transcriptional regulator n=1 Tax=Streptomyces apocyni TaxID=2654677 RepID=UPI001E560A29|nr:transcriptional regulator [Streptomyces apocyni]